MEAETDKENLSEQLESATFDLQNLRRESLAHVAELEKEAAQIRAELAASQEAAAAVDSVSEVQELKAQVSSLTFQLQELQGVAATTPLRARSGWRFSRLGWPESPSGRW